MSAPQSTVSDNVWWESLNQYSSIQRTHRVQAVESTILACMQTGHALLFMAIDRQAVLSLEVWIEVTVSGELGKTWSRQVFVPASDLASATVPF
jgi:hypothetical protein